MKDQDLNSGIKKIASETVEIPSTAAKSRKRSVKLGKIPKWKSVAAVFPGRKFKKDAPDTSSQETSSLGEDFKLEEQLENRKPRRSLVKRMKKSKSISLVVQGVNKSKNLIARRISKHGDKSKRRQRTVKVSANPTEEDLSLMTMVSSNMSDRWSSALSSSRDQDAWSRAKTAILSLYLICSIVILGWQVVQNFQPCPEEPTPPVDTLEIFEFVL